MTSIPVFMNYTKGDLTNLTIAMLVALVIIPMTIQTEYWYTSILIPWLCLSDSN